MKNLIIILILVLVFGSARINYLCAEPINLFIDRVSPDFNSLSAGKSENIIIYFLQDINPSTLNDSGIKIYGNQTGSLSKVISYNAGTKTVTINPLSNFKTGELINVNINNNIKTIANIPIDPISFSFTVVSPRGSGSFSMESASIGQFIIEDIIPGDFDNDGAIDLMALNIASQKAGFFKNNGSGLFILNNVLTLDSVLIQSYAAGDYDGDGDLDLVFIQGVYYQFKMQIYINDGNGNFIRGNLSNALCERASGRMTKSYDIDNDGDIDLMSAAGGPYGASIDIRINNGNAVFGYGGCFGQPNCFGSTLARGINSYEFTDVNNDGSIDFLMDYWNESDYDPGCNCFHYCHAILLQTNDGHGIFSSQAEYSFPESHRIICTGDFNNDGYSDVVCNGLLLKNNGDGNFISSPFLFLNKVISGDFESDGDLDIIAAETNSINIYKNNGDATFSAPDNFEIGFYPVGLRSGDFDGDCDLDIAVCNSGTNNITLLRNSSVNGNCSLTGPESIPLNAQSILYTTSDINGYWEIFNIPPCSASINGSYQNDSVYVNAGSSSGEFVLSHRSFDDCGLDYCAMRVNVEVPLPVEISAFVSVINDNNVTLRWTTNSERNNSGFELERRVGIDVNQNIWTKRGFINGNGTTFLAQNYEFTDRNLSSGKYEYRLKQIDFNGNFEYFDLKNAVNIGIPEKYDLSQNYPNPFNPVTKINFSLPAEGKISLQLYDVSGRLVETLINNEFFSAGFYSWEFKGESIASGIYFYKLSSGNFAITKKMMLIK